MLLQDGPKVIARRNLQKGASKRLQICCPPGGGQQKGGHHLCAEDDQRSKFGFESLRDVCLATESTGECRLIIAHRRVAFVQSEEHNKEELLFDNEKVDASRASPPSLQAGLPSLGLATIKDFFRFYALGSDGRLDPRMTVESLNSQAERFFAGFTRVTGSVITE